MILSRSFVRVYFIGLVSMTLIVLLSGCWKHEKPNITYMPNMAYSQAIKAQEDPNSELDGSKKGMMTPVPGTVSRDHYSYEYAGNVAGASAKLRNPHPRNRSILYEGKNLFNSYCAVCHGPGGQGDGSIVPRYPMPPSLTSERVRGYPDGRIFHIMTEGQNLMPSYASQIEPEERWKIVHYVRALYKAANPTAAERNRAKDY